MKYPPRKHHSRTHDSRSGPYPTAQRWIDRKSRTSEVQSRHPHGVDPPRSTHSRPKKVARRDPRTASNDRGGGYRPWSPAGQTVGGESPDYQSESDVSASDSGEENRCHCHSELEQLKDQIIEFRREQSQQIHGMDKRTRELVQQTSALRRQLQEQPQVLADRILSPLVQRTFTSITQGKQDQAHHGATGELGTIDPVEMFSKGSEAFS